MQQLLIDGDGCPVMDIAIQVAKEWGINCTIFCDTAHLIEKPGVQTVMIQKGQDAVDFVIANRVKVGDIVITQDHGLAAMILSKKGYVINPSGFVYTEENIDQLLFRRHIVKAARKTGTRLKGPKKRQKKDDEKFKDAFWKLCQKSKNTMI
jgi:hypothetical protein